MFFFVVRGDDPSGTYLHMNSLEHDVFVSKSVVSQCDSNFIKTKYVEVR